MATPQVVAGTNIPVNPRTGSVDMNALIQGTVDRVTGFYYYTLELAAGALLQPQYNLFNAAVGDQDPYPLVVGDVLTKVKTNILTRSSQGFAPPYDIVLDSLGIEVDPNMTPGDIDIITRYSYFEMKILEKMQWEGKIEAYPAGMGIGGATSQNAQSQWNIGNPDPNCRKRFGRFGKYLGPQTMWSWTLNFPQNAGPVAGGVHTQAQLSSQGNGACVRFYLFGLLDRPVT